MYVSKQLPSTFSDAMKIRLQCRLNTSYYDLAKLVRSAKHEKINIFYGSHGQPIGYISWADVNSYTLRMCYSHKDFPSYFHEINDGKIMLIDNLVFVPSWRYNGREKWLNYVRNRKAIAFFRKNTFSLYRYGKKYFYRNFNLPSI